MRTVTDTLRRHAVGDNASLASADVHFGTFVGSRVWGEKAMSDVQRSPSATIAVGNLLGRAHPGALKASSLAAFQLKLLDERLLAFDKATHDAGGAAATVSRRRRHTTHTRRPHTTPNLTASRFESRSTCVQELPRSS